MGNDGEGEEKRLITLLHSLSLLYYFRTKVARFVIPVFNLIYQNQRHDYDIRCILSVSVNGGE